jgi:anti-anti-sigma regulatory factor
MTVKGSHIEVTVIGQAAFVRFKRTECVLWSVDPRSDVGEELFALTDMGKHSVIVIDLSNPDVHWLSCAFEGLLVDLHRRLSRANGVLKLCNVPDSVLEQLTMNRLIEVFNVYPNLEAALKSDTSE